MNDEVVAALTRARKHLRLSALEGVEAALALLEAAMHSSGQATAEADSMVGQLQQQLNELISGLSGDGALKMPRAIAAPLGDAIDAEIKRWERRSQTDPDSRLVLRAFLGLRELLWEVGMRTDDANPATQSSSPTDATSTSPTPRKPHPHASKTEPPVPPKRDRVQRFKIED